MKNKTSFLSFLVILGLVTSAHAQLSVGDTLGIDFGDVDGSAAADDWNVIGTRASGSFGVGNMIDTSGSLISSLDFSWSAFTDDSSAPDIISGVPVFPDAALDDAMLARDGATDGDGGTSDGTITLTFTGLDDSLLYDITLGQSNTATNGNTDTAWTIGSTTLNSSPVNVGSSAYVTFSGIASSGGEIVITSLPIAGGLDISAISALELAAVAIPEPAAVALIVALFAFGVVGFRRWKA